MIGFLKLTIDYCSSKAIITVSIKLTDCYFKKRKKTIWMEAE